MKRLGLAFALVVAASCAAVAQIGGLMFPGPGPRIASASLSCSYTPVTTGTQGTAYTGATPSASGGTPAYTFSETGTLPGGLSISSSTGVISGTPTANGSFPTIQVKVTDSTSTVANCGSAFTLVIAPSSSPVTVTFQSAQFGSISGPSYTFAATIGASASANRRLVFVFWADNHTTANVTGAIFTPNTGSPVSADIISWAGDDPSTGLGSYMISAVVPTGATISVLLTTSGTGSNTPRTALYTLDNSVLSSPTTPVVGYNHFTTSPSTINVVVASGAGVIAQVNLFGVTTESWTAGVTSDFVGFGTDWGSQSNASASASYPITNTWTVSGSGNPDIAAWVFR